MQINSVNKGIFHFLGARIWCPCRYTVMKILLDTSLTAYNRSGATRAIALDISKTFDRVWHAGLLYELKSYGVCGQTFGLILPFLGNRWLRVVLHRKFSQEYPVNAGVLQGSILGPHFSYYTLVTFLMM